MSLLVSIVARDEGHDVSDLEAKVREPNNNLFGFETWRDQVWGHPFLESLGLTLIPSLKQRNVLVFGDEVEALKKEFLIIQSKLEEMALVVHYTADSIGFRVSNALAAIEAIENDLNRAGIEIA